MLERKWNNIMSGISCYTRQMATAQPLGLYLSNAADRNVIQSMKYLNQISKSSGITGLYFW
jgi:hypothetical protein